MNTQTIVGIAASIALFLMPMTAPQAQVAYGGDVYHSGANATVTTTTSRDAFVAGFSAELGGNIGGDGHAAGFDVDVDATIGADLYATGASVSVGGAVREDVTAGGFSVRLRSGASVGGNARLAGGSVTVEAPVDGSLVASGGSIRLDAPVGGDVRLNAADIEFGDRARIAGNLTYSAPNEIDIPSSVIDADRVRFIGGERWRSLDEWRDMVGEPGRVFLPTLFSAISAFVVTLAFLLLIAAIFFAVAPATVERARLRIVEKPGASLLTGVLALSTLIGLVPVSAMTLVGIPLIPIVILFIVLGWTLAYALGAYALSLRVASAFWDIPQSTVFRLIVLAAGLIVLAILNFIPVAGWLVNFTVVLLGLGAILRLVTGWLSGSTAGTDTEALGRQDT